MRSQIEKIVEAVYPLAPMQQGMLFHALQTPESDFYVYTSCHEMAGRVDEDAFRQAWEAVVARHDVLRTAFTTHKRIAQVVFQRVPLPMRIEDWRQYNSSEHSGLLAAYLANERTQGFNLQTAPLFRLALIRLTATSYYFVWTCHQILLDGWSNMLLLREVVAYYGAFSRGEPIRLPDPIPYRTFIAWLERRDPAAAENYWKTQLSGFSEAHPLPLERRARNLVSTDSRGERTRRLDASETLAIERLARSRQLTVNTVLQGAWARLIHQYTGHTDILFGTAVAGRPASLRGVERMIGVFINTVPVRIQIDSDSTVMDWLAQLQQNQADAHEHQYSPLYEIQRWSGVRPGEPLFESMLVFENFASGPSGDRSGTSQQERSVKVEEKQVFEKLHYPLRLKVAPDPVLTFVLSYDADRYRSEDADQLLDGIVQLLLVLTVSPDLRVDAWTTLRPAEREILLKKWSDGKAPQDACSVVREFEDRAAQMPHRIVTVYEEHRVSYGTLNRRANQLAHFLIRSGVGSGVRVGLFMDRSVEMITGILATLKAGGAYVPLEPEYPAARLAYMIENAGVLVVLTEKRKRLGLPAGWAQVICIDEWDALEDESQDNPAVGRQEEDAAYVIFTSGSTGRPRGVEVEHRSLNRYVKEIRERLSMEEDWNYALVSTMAADLGNTVMYPGLLGGTLHVLSADRALNGRKLGEYVERERVDCIKITPTQMKAVSEVGLKRVMPARCLVMGGEASDAAWVRELKAMAPECRIANHYGPTECTVGVITYETAGEDAGSIPIGRPLPGTEVYVLDKCMELAPVGVPGELYIGGLQLARAYVNAPDVTADKFVPNPFGRVGQRLYRTGDLVKWKRDGNLEYLGRIDEQVKLRGYRIELGEIEALLKEQPGVRHSAVVLREDEPGDRRLVAYVAADRETRDARRLRAALGQSLPEYMTPSVYVFLDQLPFTRNGKLDRRALPNPERPAPPDKEEPQTPVEEIIAGIWEGVLKRDAVGSDDDFFELGGHSLFATQVISRINETFAIELPLKSIFDCPTVAGLSNEVDQARNLGRSTAAQPIVPSSREIELPLSYAQQRLWFLEQLEAGTGIYNVQSVRLRGRIGLPALKKTLSEIMRRHEVLRTSFPVKDGRPIQHIGKPLPMSLPLVDLCSAAPSVARRLIEQERLSPFDLQNGPVWRVCLLRLDVEDHVLVSTIHHIATDAWSGGILRYEFSKLYAAYSAGLASPLEDLKVQYADFAAWQRERLKGRLLEEQLGFWKENLKDLVTLEMPADRPRPVVPNHSGHVHEFRIDPETTAKLRELGKQEGATLFMTLLACFEVLLARHSGQWDIAVGTDIANRNHIDTEYMIGFFVNQLVLRARMNPEESFRRLLRDVRNLTLSAYEHQDVPFEELVKALDPARDLNRAPLFQVKVVLQNTPKFAAPEKIDKVAAESFEARPRIPINHDLQLVLNESGKAIYAGLTYDPALFDAPRIARMVGHYRQLLDAVVRTPDKKLRDLEMLTAAERHEILEEWNPGPYEHAATECVHHLFEHQAKTNGDAIAVVCEEAHWSYECVNMRANLLASRLMEIGVTPDVRVGLSARRSAEMVVGILGIMKAGGAYAPLDPGYPAGRLTSILDDARVAVVVTQRELRDVLPAGSAQVVEIETDRPNVGNMEDPGRQTALENLAYVMYTSGSSGAPKGVMVTHRGLSNYVQWSVEKYGMNRQGTVLHSSLAFDLSVTAMFGALVGGVSVRMVKEDRSDALGNVLNEGGAYSVVKLTPSHLALLEERSIERSWVGTLVVGREALKYEQLAAWRKQAPATELVNEYGLTETVVGCCVHEIGANDRFEGDVAIGRAIPGMQMYVLDEWMMPVPAGVEGELYVGGVQLARGYLDRPELTAERFVPNAFASEPGARIYRSGDCCRWTKNGELEFLGRADGQVKPRGYRIECGEIEGVLMQHQGVRQATVVVREDEPGDQRLVAYVVTDRETARWPEKLRQAVAEKLPEYMRPNDYVYLAEMPLTSNGKLDRAALPRPERQSRAEDEGLPRTPVEEIVTAIWEQVLRRGSVQPHEDFFELGGHSLLATQVLSRVNETFNVDLPLSTMFESPTAARLSKEIELARKQTRALAMPPLLAVDRRQELPLSYAQQRLWFLDQLEGGTALYNVPKGVRLLGPIDLAGLQWTLSEIMKRHEVLRTSFPIKDGRPVQRIADEWRMPLPLIDVRFGGESLALRLAREDVSRPFHLDQGPVWRAVILKMGDEDHALLLTMHHVVSDGWSAGLLVSEFAELYESWKHQRTPRLPSLPVQYADYAYWQRTALSQEVLESQLDYWRTQLDGLTPLELPTDRVRPAAPSHRGGRYRLRIGKLLRAKLRALSRSEKTSLFMTLLAGFDVLLARYSGQWDVVVGSPITWRTRVETENLIGLFLNTMVLRVQMKPGWSFQELLRSVRNVTLEAYERQDLPFERLVDEIAPDRDISRSPLFQVMFVMQNARTVEKRKPGLKTEAWGAGHDLAKFDLTLGVVEELRGLELVWEYTQDLFDAATVHQMAAHYSQLLEAVATDPGQRICEIPLLGPDENPQWLRWGVAPAPYSEQRCVHELFDEKAEANPERIAVAIQDCHISYGELSRRSNAFAWRLIDLGVEPDVRVALCMERSLDVVVGILGILKAGGAYVPLDPDYPAERLAYMLEDAQAPVLVTESKLKDRLPTGWTQVVCIDQDNSNSHRPSSSPAVALSGECLAYVMYTSGSAGRPKGVLITHSNLRCSTLARHAAYKDQVETFLLLYSFAFDSSLNGLFWTLSSGARLIVATHEHVRDAEKLIKLCLEENVSHFSIPPLLYGQLLNQHRSPFPALQCPIVAGEECPPDVVRLHHEYQVTRPLFNEYGPTECTVWSTYALLGPGDSRQRVPIGGPVPNVAIYVLDDWGAPVPPGVVGELCIGGGQVGRGYLNRPEVTAEKFIPDPFGDNSGGRIYCTGDRARWLRDGTLEFLGRIDEQVKLRGYRIELGEVEVALKRHPHVDQAVVILREDGIAGRRLVAYIVSEGEGPAPEVLRDHLAQFLPEYMIPAIYVTVPSLPLTAHGKLDRKALSKIKGALREDGREALRQPRDTTEAQLLQIWHEVLGRNDIHLDDNFFAAGGTSLSAVVLVSKIGEIYNRAVSVDLVFRHQTLEELAAYLRREVSVEPPQVLVPMQTQGSEPPLFCVHPAGGLPHVYVNLARALGSEQPFYAFQSRGFTDELGFEMTIEDMAADYIAEMRKKQPHEPYRLAGWSLGGIVAYEMARQLRSAGNQVDLLAIIDAGLRDAPERPVFQPLQQREIDLQETEHVRRQAADFGIDLPPLEETEDYVRAYLDSLKQLLIVPKDVTLAQYRRFLKVYASNEWASQCYHPQPYDGRISLLVTAGNRDKTIRCWEVLAPGRVCVYELPGQHSELMKKPNVLQVTQRLQAAIADVGRDVELSAS